MSTQQSEAFQWRRDVRSWLASVLQYQQQSGLSFRTAAHHCQQSFPSSAVVQFAGRSISKGIAAWAVKDALRGAATSLNVSIDADTLDFLSDLAVDVILAAA